MAVRRAIVPPLFSPHPVTDGAEKLSVPLLRASIADAWTLYHAADFGRVMELLPGIIADARLTAAVGRGEDRAAGQHALGKALQLGGHMAIRLGKTDLALASLERAITAAEASGDPLLGPMVCTSVAWAYQRQNRLEDARDLAIHTADDVEHAQSGTADGVRVWGGLLMSAATTTARSGDYAQASDMMKTPEG